MRTNNNSNSLLSLICLAVAVIIFGIAGNSDLEDQILVNMPDEIYTEIYTDLKASHGCDPSDSDIVKEYKNRYHK